MKSNLLSISCGLLKQVRILFSNNKHLVILLCIILASFFLNYINNTFPYYYHGDEDDKAKFIRTGTTSFYHPMLMLLVNRFINYFLGFTRYQDIVVLGRTLSAAFGAMIVLATYLFAKSIIHKKLALLAALAVAVMPIMVIHAHYLKEDIIMTTFTIGCIPVFFRFIKETTLFNSILLGLFEGLAFSSKYIGAVMLLVLLLAPVVCSIQNKADVYKKILFVFGVALAVFFLTNIYMICNFSAFQEGIAFEAKHVVTGHTEIAVYPTEHFFMYHLKNSIIPEITWPITILSLLYISYIFIKWSRVRWEEKYLLLYLLVFYLVLEISPLKPEPDYIRYVIPLIPVFCYFSLRTVEEIIKYITKSKRLLITSLTFAPLLIYPLYDSINLVSNLKEDTREQLNNLFKKDFRGVYSEIYTKEEPDTFMLCDLLTEEIPQGTKYLVASSFVYERYFKAIEFSKDVPEIVEKWRFYKKLFENKYIEIRPKYRSYAFSNPTIRIFKVKDLMENGTVKGNHLRKWGQIFKLG